MISIKKLIESNKLEKNLIEKIVDVQKIIENHLLIPYNETVTQIEKFYSGRKQLICSVKTDEGNQVQYYLEFDKLHFEKPNVQYSSGELTNLSPNLAIMKQVSYLANMVTDLKLLQVSNNITTVKNTSKNKLIGQIPIMLGSVLDPYVEKNSCKQGYFILRGVQKLLLTIEEIEDNTPIPSVTDEKRQIYVYSSIKGYRYINRLTKHNRKPLELKFQPLNISICPLALLRVLGYTDADIINKVVYDNDSQTLLTLLAWIQRSGKDRSEQHAIQIVAKTFSISDLDTVKDKIKHVVQTYMLMHLGTDESSVPIKMQYLAKLIRSILHLTLYKKQPINVDNIEHKHIKTPGILLYELFQYCFNKQMEHYKSVFIKNKGHKTLNLLALFKAELLTNGLISPIVSGNWLGNRKDVSTTIQGTNYYNYLSAIRKIISPLTKTQLHHSARSISKNFRGRICPLDSGHGTIIGLVKSIATGCLVTLRVDISHVIKKFKPGNTPLYVDQIFIRLVNSKQFIQDFRALRANGEISIFANYSIDNDSINVRCYQGRLTRILLTKTGAKAGNEMMQMSYDELLKHNYIQWLDSLEQNMYKISPEINLITENEYSEISPILLYSLTAGSIPFINNSGPARISYGQKLFKQAIVSVPKLDETHTDRKKLSISYTEKPLVYTKLQDSIEPFLKNRYPGVNIVIAILPYDGFNLEDAIVMNKAAVDRNLFKTYVYDYTNIETNISLTNDLVQGFKHPVEVNKSKAIQYYSEIDSDGLCSPNSFIEPGYAIGTNCSLPRYSSVDRLLPSAPEYVDNTTFNNKLYPVQIAEVLITKSLKLSNVAHIKKVVDRPTIVGDKFSSRYAQKGVIGALLNPWNLIYEKYTGITPDMVIAGSAYPTRYLIGHLYESLIGKQCALQGGLAQLFFSNTIQSYDDLFHLLSEKGLGEYSHTEFIDAKTGLTIKSKIFTGVSYYLKLQHLAEEKLHMRSTGPVQLLTRQATEGRAQAGGLRIGEMQRDCIIAYGASDLILERLNIDLSSFLVCGNCGQLLDFYEKQNIKCKLCNSGSDIHCVKVPYAFKLLIDELNALHVKVKLVLDKYGQKHNSNGTN